MLTESVEEPSVRVEFLLVGLLQTEDELNRDSTDGNISSLTRSEYNEDVKIGIHNQRRKNSTYLADYCLSSHLKDVSRHFLVAN